MKKVRPKCKRISGGVSVRFKRFLSLCDEDREPIGWFILSVAKSAVIREGKKQSPILGCVGMIRCIEKGLAEVVFWDDGTASARVIPGTQVQMLQ